MDPTTAQTSAPSASKRTDADRPDLAEVVDYVTTYVKQETLGPLQGAARWLAFGVGAAFLLGIGLTLVLLGILRLIQTEWEWAAEGSWSWIAYLIALAVCVLVLVLTISRIKRDQLHKERY